MSILIFLLLTIISKVYSNDIIFLIDSSPSVFNSECNYHSLIQNFTSNLVNELDYCDIKYASAQYNVFGYLDYNLSNNNTFVYNKMLNYKFIHGAPTLIDSGFKVIIDLYKNKRIYDNNIFFVLISDGDTLNRDIFKKTLNFYPFNSSKIINILIKVPSSSSDDYVFNLLNTSYRNLNCKDNPLESIISSYNFCPLTTTTLTTTTLTTTTLTTTTFPTTTFLTTTFLTTTTLTTTTFPTTFLTTTFPTTTFLTTTTFPTTTFLTTTFLTTTTFPTTTLTITQKKILPDSKTYRIYYNNTINESNIIHNLDLLGLYILIGSILLLILATVIIISYKRNLKKKRRIKNELNLRTINNDTYDSSQSINRTINNDTYDSIKI
jgi:hypothetical protein